jgi:uncharacterized protein
LRVQERFELAAAPDAVWPSFSDLDRLVRHIPGANLAESSGEGPYEGEIAVKFGPRVIKFRGKATYACDASIRRGTVDASGVDVRGNSRAVLHGVFNVLRSDDDSNRTIVLMDGDVSFTGPLAELAETGARHAMRAIMSQFAESFSSELGNSAANGNLSPSEGKSIELTSLLVVITAHAIGDFLARVGGIWKRLRKPRSTTVRF